MQSPEVIERIHDIDEFADRLERLERAVFGTTHTAPATTTRAAHLRQVIDQQRRELAGLEHDAHDKNLAGESADRGPHHGAAGVSEQTRINELRTSIDLLERELAGLEG